MIEEFRYASDVVNGIVLASEETKNACIRSLDDYSKSQSDPDYPYYFDSDTPQRFKLFCSKFKHLEGPKGGQPFILDDWQYWFFSQLFGWKLKSNHKRRFRTVHLEVPRGNGKSFMMTVVALWMLALDGENGPQVYSAATTRAQARIVFDAVKEHIRNNSKLMKFLGVEGRAHEILYRAKSNKGIYKALSRDAHSMDGLNIHCAIVDELHAHKSRATWDVLNSGSAKRDQSVMIAITTAGFDLSSLGYEQRQYCSKVNKGVFQDDSFLGCIWCADPDDSPYVESTWIKANPSWYSAINQSKFADDAQKAKNVPAERTEFLTKHLNMWLNAGDTFYDLPRLTKGYNETLKCDSFKDVACYVGVDLSMVDDMTAVVQVFSVNNELYVFPHYFLPQKALDDHKNAAYAGWAEQGFLHVIPGPVIDFPYIKDFIEGICNNYEIRSINIDDWCAKDIAEALEVEGWPVQYSPQGIRLTNAAKKLQELILREKVHYNNPIFTWNVSNCHASFDWNGNVKIHKEFPKSPNKIDGVAATLNCLDPMVHDSVFGDCVREIMY